LRPAIPEDRRYFFDYEFTDAIRLIRGIYKLSIATQATIDRLAAGDRAGALAALLEARPLTEELHAAFRNQCGTDKWRYWFRSGTNEDFYLLYNLYQKARLRLEVETLNFVTDIEPQRHPFLGNVVMHDPARAGDAVYSSQAERINTSVYNGSPYSITEFPLEGVFQIGGVRSVYGKWIGKDSRYVPDYGLGYRFKLDGPATVFVAKPKGKKLDWLGKSGFKATGQTMLVGHWDWPYRYRNRPPTDTIVFDFVSKQFPAGEVTLGPNAKSDRQLPYIVFVQPSLLAFENFRRNAIGSAPAAWKITGRATVVDVPDYDAEMRPSAFDLSTVPRYRPLDLRALKLERGASAELKFTAPAADDFVLHARLKLDQPGTLALCAADGKPAIEVPLKPTGKWQNVSLRVSPAQRKYSVEVQDDALRVAKTDNLAFLDGANGPLERLKLVSGGAPLICNAMTAWRAKP
jgi:hypothetical protein